MGPVRTIVDAAFDAGGRMPLDQRQDPEVRKLIGRGALPVFFGIADAWGLGPDDQRTLLGGIPSSTFYKWKSGEPGAMTYDQLERVSLVLGIFKALKLLFVNDRQGIAWLKANNTAPAFGGGTPLERGLRGGIDDLYSVRRYLDAWRGVK